MRPNGGRAASLDKAATLRLCPPGALRELASGVDALYLSGHAVVPSILLSRLKAVRELAEEAGEPEPMDFGGMGFSLSPHGWGRYRYLLVNGLGRVGITATEHLPAVRIQPRAELLHALGPEAAVAGFSEILQKEMGEVLLSVNRLDLFADWQGWSLEFEDRLRFSCRADTARQYEENGRFRGFEFGRRATKTLCARVYDKTADVERTGADWWHEVWGERYAPAEQPVIRVEFEFGRKGLQQFGLDSPAEVLGSVADLWRYATREWLTYRALRVEVGSVT